MTVREFPVGWVSFDETLRMPEGFTHFVVVDDYSTYSLWDRLRFAFPRIGSRPQGHEWESADITLPGSELPKGTWNFIHVMYSMAREESYASAGIMNPGFDQLPAVYAIKHGQLTGKYVWNVTVDQAVEFIQAQLAER